MEKYENAEMEVIEFEAEDVINSSCTTDLAFCSTKGPDDDNDIIL